ncbi:aldose 1-epimerase family protein [Reichenbachiella agarivorans]|uniref:Aldose 1-epimerase family protein n=1 Tax=Reichenbachiella agarivorans TaxID=2979464 RepID=A0ABY6CJC3_9BACT|nr:aldose 1-epimerase family protein [Reichenbachiella agarivorans]UXP30624.1 aldose 1-epimerase family protein [Reichenbachiella agarivorans]
MKYSIENSQFRVEVEELGAELCSIKSLKSEREYIWQADPKIWASSAPVLFPNIGLLKDGSYKFEGKTYQLPKHGIIRNNAAVKLINRSPSRLSFSLSHSEETMKVFPFEFEFKINFLLMDNRLQVFHEVVNTGKNPMYFSIGGHPAFNCLWNEGESLSDYYIEFEEDETASISQLTPGGLLMKEEIPFLKESKKLYLSEKLFDKDALIFTELHSSEISLKSKKNKIQIKMNFADFPFLGIWSKPKAPYVCLEPWDGLPDYEDTTQEWTAKIGNLKLKAGNTHYASYQIQIIEPK